MFCWAALVLASLSWLFSVHLYVSEDPLKRWLCLGCALAAGVAGFGDNLRIPRFRLRDLWLLAPLCLLSVWVPSPYRQPCWLAASGVILMALDDQEQSLLLRAGRSLLVVGMLLMLQAPVYWLVTAWCARNPQVPGAGSLLYGMLSWAGAETSLSNGRVFIRTMKGVHAFPLTWGHFGLFPLALIWVGGCAALFWRNLGLGGFVRRLAGLTLVLAGYGIIRLFAMLALFITVMLNQPHGEAVLPVTRFWLPWITAVGFIPVIPLLNACLPMSGGRLFALPEDPIHDRAWLRWVQGIGGCAVCLGVVLAFRLPDPGTMKQGRIMFDEAHSRWERTDKAYDTQWYGGESGYNYNCIAEYLKHFYDVTVNMKDPLDADKLAGCDVLILKNPTRAYDPEEVDAIADFVHAGGGLFMLGEHTDVFGTSTYLNPVARRFGMVYRPDAVFDIQRKWEQVYFPGAFGAHPIVQDIPFYRFAVSCSIDIRSWRVRPVIRGSGLWTLPIEYAAKNFYPQVVDQTYAEFGAFDQMAAGPFGRGRVVGFSDSTVYSNFLAFYPGKPELLLKTMDWLNRENGWAGWAGAGWFLVLAGAGVFLVASLWAPWCGRSAVVLVAAASLTAWLGLGACAALNRRACRLPPPVKPVPVITFDMAHSGCELPIFGFPQAGNRKPNYEVFYQWVLRCGYYPAIAFNLEKALSSDDPIILVNPEKPFSGAELKAVRAYLERGGDLLVIDAPRSGVLKAVPSTAGQLLAGFGLSFEEKTCAGTIVSPDNDAAICGLSRGCAVKGGEPLLTLATGETIVARTNVGKGQLIAAGLGARFVNTRMGYSTRGIPNAEMRAVYELSFTLFRGLIGGDMKAEARALGKVYGD